MNGFQDIWPDEVFYSAIARFLKELKSGSAKELIATLFEFNLQVAPIDLPNHLQAFVSGLSPIHSLTLDRIIDAHTLYPYHAAFLDPAAASNLRAKMAGSAKRHSLGRYGGNRGKSTGGSNLRYCPTCVKDDRATYGEAYFHRIHLVDIVRVCPYHHLILENATIHESGSDGAPREFIALEEMDPLEEGRDYEELANSTFHLNISKKVDWLLKATLNNYFASHFRAHYHNELMRRELFTYRYRKQRGLIEQLLSEYFGPDLLNELGAAISPSSRNNWVSAVMNMNRNYGAPVYHLLLAEFLSIDLEGLFMTDAPDYFGNGPWPCLNPVCADYCSECITTVAVTASSRPYRVSGAFRCHCGFAYLRYGPDFEGENKHSYDRVIDYGRVWQKRLINKWTDAKCTKKMLASELGVSQTSVYRYAQKLGLQTNNNHQTEMASRK